MTDVPDGFNNWITRNQDRIAQAEERGTLPYFITDNQGYVSKAMKGAEVQLPTTNKPAPPPLTDEERERRNAERISQLREHYYNGLLPTETAYAFDIIENANMLWDFEEAEMRISRLEKAVERHKKRNQRQVELIIQSWDKRLAAKSQLNAISKDAKKHAIRFKSVKEWKKVPSEDKLIERIGGGDLTPGSCSSLAFAFAGNKCGYNVLDFRGGRSCNFFSSSSVIMDIARKVGGIIESHTSDFEKARKLLGHVSVGKQYYFSCGSHAAVVRKTSRGFEYLELQSATDNGWKPLDRIALKDRFGAKKSHSSRYIGTYATEDCLIDIELLKKDRGFRRLLGYLNTEKTKQIKGVAGTIK